jgi:uncharacterized protein Ymh
VSRTTFRQPGTPDTARQLLDERIGERLHLIHQTITEVDPRYGNHFRTPTVSGYSWEPGNQFEAVQEAAGALASTAEHETIFGVNGPKLAAAHMHHWVWDHAASYWDDGYRRAALQSAATAIFDHYLPSKLQRGQDSRGGTDLIGQAFSKDDPSTSSRFMPRATARSYQPERPIRIDPLLAARAPRRKAP